MATKLWFGLFCIWGVFLSGALAGVVGSPGIVQALRLNELLSSKKMLADSLEREMETLEAETRRLETSRVAQEHEIRRVLGYASPDELIFDFTRESGDSLTTSQARPALRAER